MNSSTALHRSKEKFLDAALRVIRSKGHSATRVDDICSAAGLTEGSFFHDLVGAGDTVERGQPCLLYAGSHTGAFVLAKGRRDPVVAADCLRHLRRYIELQFYAAAPGAHEGDRQTAVKPHGRDAKE